MTTERNSHTLRNISGIKFHVLFNVFIQISAFFILYTTGHYPFWLLVISSCSLLFGIRWVKLNTENVIIHYPLLPFYRRIIPVSSIRKILFNLHEGSFVYPHLTLIYSKFAFYTQVRIDRDDDVEELIKILSINGKFKVKPLSDKLIMKKRLEEILSSSNCTVV